MREYVKENLIIYHGGNCSDGFGAAYAAWKHFGDSADYVPMTYEDKLELDFKNKNVYILDFSFERDVYEGIRASAKSVKLLDHHKSAWKNLCDCEGCFFNLEKSGAVIAWEHFHPKKELPLC